MLTLFSFYEKGSINGQWSMYMEQNFDLDRYGFLIFRTNPDPTLFLDRDPAPTYLRGSVLD